MLRGGSIPLRTTLQSVQVWYVSAFSGLALPQQQARGLPTLLQQAVTPAFVPMFASFPCPGDLILTRYFKALGQNTVVRRNVSPLRKQGVGGSAATALWGSHLVRLHCMDVAHKQYKQEEHWKTGNVPDISPKMQRKGVT